MLPPAAALRRLELFPDDGDDLRERPGADSEGAFDDACLTADVLRDVEDCRLALAKSTHHLKSRDGRIGGLQRLETPDRTDQWLQLALIGFDDVVQIFDLSMDRFLGAFAVDLQFRDRDPVGGALSVLITVGFSQSFKPFRALPRKRFAALAFRVGER
jgi:hypothetical protein